MMYDRIVLHIDFDYFYAQCEEIRNQSLRTKPVCVCIFSDRGGDSGAVATANYIARKFGVKSGMPIKFAKTRLKESPDAVFLPADFAYYTDISQNAMEIIKQYADIFEYVGRDEAYLDVTKRVESSFEQAGHLGQQLKNHIRESIKMTCTIGISPNKLVSKIASDYKKPDALTVILPDKIESFLGTLDIDTIPGIGKVTKEKFLEMNLKTVGDLRKLDIFTLNKMFGRKISSYMYNASRGLDDEPVSERSAITQYSRIITLRKDSKDFDFLSQHIDEICFDLHQTILKHKKMFKSVGIQFVHSDLTNKTRSRMLKNPTFNLDELKKTALVLLQEALSDQTLNVRRLGIKISELSDQEGQSSITNFF